MQRRDTSLFPLLHPASIKRIKRRKGGEGSSDVMECTWSNTKEDPVRAFSAHLRDLQAVSGAALHGGQT